MGWKVGCVLGCSLHGSLLKQIGALSQGCRGYVGCWIRALEGWQARAWVDPAQQLQLKLHLLRSIPGCPSARKGSPSQSCILLLLMLVLLLLLLMLCSLLLLHLHFLSLLLLLLLLLQLLLVMLLLQQLLMLLLSRRVCRKTSLPTQAKPHGWGAVAGQGAQRGWCSAGRTCSRAIARYTRAQGCTVAGLWDGSGPGSNCLAAWRGPKGVLEGLERIWRLRHSDGVGPDA